MGKSKELSRANDVEAYGDLEIKTMAEVLKILSPLEKKAKVRVIVWLLSKAQNDTVPEPEFDEVEDCY